MTKENQVQEVARQGLTRGGKVAIISAASVLTLGVAYGIVRLVKHVKAKRASEQGDSSSK